MTKHTKDEGDYSKEFIEVAETLSKPGSRSSHPNFFKSKDQKKQALSDRSLEDRMFNKHTGKVFSQSVYQHVKKANPQWFVKNRNNKPEKDLGVKLMPLNKFTGTRGGR